MVGKHQQIIDWLVLRLENAGRYESIETHVCYSNRRKNGEVDVLAYHEPSKTYHFYEVKSNYAKNRFHYATDQYRRYCAAFPKMKVKGILVTQQRIRRLDR